MSKVTLYECDMCGSIVKQSTTLYTNSMVYDLCNNCYKDISILEDMKHIHNVAISEINEMINKKVEGMKNERKEDII